MAYMIASLVLISLACFVAVIVGTSVGAAVDNGFGRGIWPLVIMVPWLALPLAMLLTITLLIISAVTRSRTNRDSTN